MEIQDRTGVAYLFVLHDRGVVWRIGHRVAVMSTATSWNTARAGPSRSGEYPYTRRLLMAAPVLGPAAQRKRRLERQSLLEIKALPP